MKINNIEIEDKEIELFFERLSESEYYSGDLRNFILDIAYGNKVIFPSEEDVEWYRNELSYERKINEDLRGELKELEDYQDRCLKAESIINKLGSRIYE